MVTVLLVIFRVVHHTLAAVPAEPWPAVSVQGGEAGWQPTVVR